MKSERSKWQKIAIPWPICQREVDKRQKAKDKRDNRERKKTETAPAAAVEVMARPEHLSEGEEHVLAMFRKDDDSRQDVVPEYRRYSYHEKVSR